MVGLLLWKPGEKRMRMKQVRVLRVPFICCELPLGKRETNCRRRFRAGAKKLFRLGVEQVVFPSDRTDRLWLEGTGLRPVSTLHLRQTVAADWLKQELAAQGITTTDLRIAVRADRLTEEVVRTVTDLSLRYRHLMLWIPGGERLAEQLRKWYGVSVQLRESTAGAVAAVQFDRFSDWGKDCPVCLKLGEEGPLPPLCLLPEAEAQLPPGANREMLISTLLEAGAVSAKELYIGTEEQKVYE